LQVSGDSPTAGQKKTDSLTEKEIPAGQMSIAECRIPNLAEWFTG
jgi:hypothetical protein